MSEQATTGATMNPAVTPGDDAQTKSLCSQDMDASGLPAWGSAKDASVIVGVEVNGSWGHDAVGDSGLPQPTGATLYLVRRPGHHAVTPDRQTVFVSGGFGDTPWLVSGQIEQDRVPDFLNHDVTNLDAWADFGLTVSTDSVVLVCTNGKRDLCCAVRGRPVLDAAAAAEPDRVWEVSHIGGHRFAPTAIHLPTGQTFGRLSPDDGVTLARAGRSGTLPAHLFDHLHHRGRTDLKPAARVAETFWRSKTHTYSLLPAVPFDTDQRTVDAGNVRMPDGQVLHVHAESGPELRDSCAKLPKASSYFVAEVLPE